MAQAQPHTYASKSPPGIQLDSGIKQFFEEFYKISDTGTEEAHELYADSFVKDGIIIMGIKIGRGRDGEFYSFSFEFIFWRLDF